MEFIKHTIQWCKGEIFEGKMVLLFGILFLIISLSFWKFGTTPNAKASIIPVLVVALLHIGTGVSMIINNRNRQNQYTVEFNANADNFKKSEIERTENFIKWYPKLRYFSLGLIITGFLLVALITTPMWRSIGLCIMITAFSLIIIDYFSEERAHHYHSILISKK
ncbi:hypothetical protein GKZ90_0010395 [Flavobacterium sp. MC2016-06]|jgi:hypothetical protein|uniref:hypothetical protein n=1 Tax=Flavobacterium sp. MC2016-06 TaxID=2676308 RepID=UPI0012BA6666|nr:hypothetical protein [Flavobacterium sp. MC2016-06]MBU3858509.1 hypothetical protein [Flavobacterium sp. MC2016-06]